MTLNTRSLVSTYQAPVGSTGGTSNLNQINQFIYPTDDAAATVETAGYFNAMRGRLTVGSIILAVMAIGGGTPVLKCYVVTAVPGTGNVTIALQTTASG